MPWSLPKKFLPIRRLLEKEGTIDKKARKALERKTTKKVITAAVQAVFIFILFRVSFACADPGKTLEQKEAGFFTKGSRFLSVTTARSEDDSIGQARLAQIHINEYVHDNTALSYGVLLGHIETNRSKDGFYGGPELGIRKHLINAGRFSIYADTTVATVFHQHPVIEGRLRFNFDVQAGFGSAYRASERHVLTGGFRWHHLSNARIRGKSKNLGYDGPMFYIGVMRLF